MPGPPLTRFTQVRIINLRRRRDRRRETEAELANLGERVDGRRCAFFEAIEPDEAAGFPNPAVRGCFLSHLAVLSEACRAGVEDVLVLEDDVAFVLDAGRLATEAVDQLSAMSWDIAYFGHALGNRPGQPGWLPVAGPMRHAHCYAVRARALARLVAFLRGVTKRPAGHPQGGPMHFDGALSTFVQQNPDVVAVYFSRNLAYQRPSRTDLHRPSLLDRTPILKGLAVPLRWLKRRYLKLVR
jgi:hypothetical protein